MELKEAERKIKYYNELKKASQDNESKKAYYNKKLKMLRETRKELKNKLHGTETNERK